MGYNAQGMWTPENDSSVDKLTGMLATDSPYLKGARAQGEMTAQARGLQNSSIAAGAAETAAIAAAQPFAINDANTTAQKNLSFQGFGQQTSLDKQNNDAAATRQQADIAAQDSRLTKQLGSNESISDRDAQTKLALQQLQGDQQKGIAQMNVSANAQDKAQAAATNASNIYTQNINAIIGNANIPADARQALMDNAKNMLAANVAMIEKIYNVDLNWGGGGNPSTVQGAIGNAVGNSVSGGAASNWGGSTAQTQDQASANYGSSGSAPQSGQIVNIDPNSWYPINQVAPADGAPLFNDGNGNLYKSVGNNQAVYYGPATGNANNNPGWNPAWGHDPNNPYDTN